MSKSIIDGVPVAEPLLTSKAALISVSVGAAGGSRGISSSISAGTGVVRLLPPELLNTLTYDAGNQPSCRLRPFACKSKQMVLVQGIAIAPE